MLVSFWRVLWKNPVKVDFRKEEDSKRISIFSRTMQTPTSSTSTALRSLVAPISVPLPNSAALMVEADTSDSRLRSAFDPRLHRQLFDAPDLRQVLADTIVTHYPSDRQLQLDAFVCALLLHRPEHAEWVLRPLLAMMISPQSVPLTGTSGGSSPPSSSLPRPQRMAKYARRSFPFSAVVDLFLELNHLTERELTPSGSANLETYRATCMALIDQLARPERGFEKIVPWLVDCLHAAPKSFQKEFFQRLFETFPAAPADMSEGDSALDTKGILGEDEPAEGEDDGLHVDEANHTAQQPPSEDALQPEEEGEEEEDGELAASKTKKKAKNTKGRRRDERERRKGGDRKRGSKASPPPSAPAATPLFSDFASKVIAILEAEMALKRHDLLPVAIPMILQLDRADLLPFREWVARYFQQNLGDIRGTLVELVNMWLMRGNLQERLLTILEILSAHPAPKLFKKCFVDHLLEPLVQELSSTAAGRQAKADQVIAWFSTLVSHPVLVSKALLGDSGGGSKFDPLGLKKLVAIISKLDPALLNTLLRTWATRWQQPDIPFSWLRGLLWAHGASPSAPIREFCRQTLLLQVGRELVREPTLVLGQASERHPISRLLEVYLLDDREEVVDLFPQFFESLARGLPASSLITVPQGGYGRAHLRDALAEICERLLFLHMSLLSAGQPSGAEIVVVDTLSSAAMMDIDPAPPSTSQPGSSSAPGSASGSPISSFLTMSRPPPPFFTHVPLPAPIPVPLLPPPPFAGQGPAPLRISLSLPGGKSPAGVSRAKSHQNGTTPGLNIVLKGPAVPLTEAAGDEPAPPSSKRAKVDEEAVQTILHALAALTKVFESPTSLPQEKDAGLTSELLRDLLMTSPRCATALFSLLESRNRKIKHVLIGLLAVLATEEHRPASRDLANTSRLTTFFHSERIRRLVGFLADQEERGTTLVDRVQTLLLSLAGSPSLADFLFGRVTDEIARMLLTPPSTPGQPPALWRHFVLLESVVERSPSKVLLALSMARSHLFLGVQALPDLRLVPNPHTLLLVVKVIEIAHQTAHATATLWKDHLDSLVEEALSGFGNDQTTEESPSAASSATAVFEVTLRQFELLACVARHQPTSRLLLERLEAVAATGFESPSLAVSNTCSEIFLTLLSSPEDASPGLRRTVETFLTSKYRKAQLSRLLPEFCFM